MILASALLAGTSLLVFVVFLYRGPLRFVDLGLHGGAVLAWDALLCLVFFAQHSGMVRRGFRTWSGAWISSRYQAALYSIASGVALWLLVGLWQQSPSAVLALEGASRWGARAVFLLAIAGMIWSVRAIGVFDSFGIEAIRASHDERQAEPARLAVRGPYRLVRHPMYACVLLMLWSHPAPTPDRLLFDVAWTVWIWIGTVLEERDLVVEFGESYREYQRGVPMLVPWRRGRWPA